MGFNEWITVGLGVGLPALGALFAAFRFAVKLGEQKRAYEDLRRRSIRNIRRIRRVERKVRLVMRFQYERGWGEAIRKGHIRLGPEELGRLPGEADHGESHQ